MKSQDQDVPVWQEISGISPEREKTMTADERDAGIRKLLKEVEQRALAEFARGEKTPVGERTILWDALERICAQLGISRVKLSSLTRELTGMRAHEVTDRIKARKLPTVLNAWMEKRLAPRLESLCGPVDRAKVKDPYYVARMALKVWRQLKRERSGAAAARWAAELGFANPSRLSRACLLAQGMSFDELEQRVVCCMVQKFLEANCKDQPQSSQRTQRTEEKGKKGMSEAERIIQEAVDAVIRPHVA